MEFIPIIRNLSDCSNTCKQEPGAPSKQHAFTECKSRRYALSNLQASKTTTPTICADYGGASLVWKKQQWFGTTILMADSGSKQWIPYLSCIFGWRIIKQSVDDQHSTTQGEGNTAESRAVPGLCVYCISPSTPGQMMRMQRRSLEGDYQTQRQPKKAQWTTVCIEVNEHQTI